jgi:hypothetical protein
VTLLKAYESNLSVCQNAENFFDDLLKYRRDVWTNFSGSWTKIESAFDFPKFSYELMLLLLRGN